MKKILSPWLKVDSRALGIYRILLGWLCFWDIVRRWNYIDVFYSDQGIKFHEMGIPSKAFTIFNYISTDSLTMHIIFAIGIFFSIMLMLGYKSKLSHFITAIIIISIHVHVTEVGNSADMFMNCMLIWTLFLPLGTSLSLDSLINSLNKFKENNLEELNNRGLGINYATQIYSWAYLAMLFQISAIYFFTALDKHGPDWSETYQAFFRMHQLDIFITPMGYYIRDYITYPISKFFTLATLYLEYSIPLLLFIPFYRHLLRLIAVISLTIFHLMIRLSMNVGLFSQVMITTYPLIIDQKIIDFFKKRFLNRYASKQFILFYDSDCGFCHYTIRIIKRLDVFNRIIFAHGNTDTEKPDGFDNLRDKTAILYNPNTKKIWTRHEAFGKIISLIPFGILFSWIFFIPIISNLFGKIYDEIAENRTKISIFFGLPACNLPGNENIKLNNGKSRNDYYLFIATIMIAAILFKKYWVCFICLGFPFQYFFIIDWVTNHFKKIARFLSPILIITMLTAALNSALIKNPGVSHFLDKNPETTKLLKQYGLINLSENNMPNDQIKNEVINSLLNIKSNPQHKKLRQMKNKVIKTDKNKYFNWDNKEMLKTITTIPRMHQMWKMFSPNVLAVDNTVIVEAYLNDGTVIDLFTGKKPILDNTDQKILMKDKSQLWRKYFEHGMKTSRHAKLFENWIMDPNNDYFNQNLKGRKIDSLAIKKITMRNYYMDVRDGEFYGIKKLNYNSKPRCLNCASDKKNRTNKTKTDYVKPFDFKLSADELYNDHKNDNNKNKYKNKILEVSGTIQSFGGKNKKLHVIKEKSNHIIFNTSDDNFVWGSDEIFYIGGVYCAFSITPSIKQNDIKNKKIITIRGEYAGTNQEILEDGSRILYVIIKNCTEVNDKKKKKKKNIREVLKGYQQ